MTGAAGTRAFSRPARRRLRCPSGQGWPPGAGTVRIWCAARPYRRGLGARYRRRGATDQREDVLRDGWIISSIAGKCSTPGNGTYSATKFAVEALSDALRWELAPFGIQVVVIEPGSISTRFDATAQAHARPILANLASPYHALYQRSERFAESMRRQGAGPEAVSRVIQRAMDTANPRRRHVVALPISGRIVMRLGDAVWDAVVQRMFQIRAPGARPWYGRQGRPIAMRNEQGRRDSVTVAGS